MRATSSNNNLDHAKFVHPNTCKLSVLLVTYNHAKYIKQALNTLFAQKIEGNIELVIADDGSTDNTIDIIREFEKRESQFIFKYLDNSTNLGITRNYQRGFAACAGAYVAVLEGDDYWINPRKLQCQCDFLDIHWETDLCSVNYFVYEEDKSAFTVRTTIGTGHRFIDSRDLIVDNLVGNFSTCMYRKIALDTLPIGLFEIKSYDWIVNICIARYSLIGFLEEPMSVYRLHANGIWTNKSYIEKFKEQLNLIPIYDELTDYIFHSDFEKLSNRLQRRIKISNVARPFEGAIRPISKYLLLILDFIPPLILIVIRVLVPPKIQNLFSRLIHRDVT